MYIIYIYITVSTTTKPVPVFQTKMPAVIQVHFCDLCVSSIAPDRLPQSWSHDSLEEKLRILAPSQIELNFQDKNLRERPKNCRLKAFYPFRMIATSCTWLTSLPATILCLYFHVETNSMGYVKSFQTFHHPTVPRSLQLHAAAKRSPY